MSDGKPFLRIVGCAKPKSEPMDSYESATRPAYRHRGVNLYVCNLDARVDDDYLRNLFTPFGTILSSKVMCDPNQCPRGFGFVCFSTAEEAERAIAYMNGHTVFSQILHVSVAREKGYKKDRYAEHQKMHLDRYDDDDEGDDDDDVVHSQHEQSSDEKQVNFKRKNEDHQSDGPRGRSEFRSEDAGGLSSRLASLLNQKSFSDVQFAIGGDIFYAHKLVLALSSEVFASMFYGNHALNEMKTIVVSDVTSAGFSNMLQYMYTDYLEFRNVQDAKETLVTAQKYSVPNLLTKCRDYLFGSCEITANNVCFILENAEIAGISDVEDKCQRIFQTETKEVLKSSHFLSSDLTTVEAILKNEYLNIDSELDLIQAVVAWGREDCRSKNVPPEASNVRVCVGPLMKYLRFLSLPTEVFFKVVKETELLSPPEACLITLKLSQPELSIEFPPGLCTKTSRRVPPSAARLSFCYFKFPLIETEQHFSTGFKDDIKSTLCITVDEGQVKIRGVILQIKKLRFQADVLDVSVDVQSNSDEYSFQEKIKVSDEPITVMLKEVLHISRKQSALLGITIEDLQVNRCYSCTKSDLSIEKTDTKLRVQLSGSRTNINGSFLFPVSLLLYEKSQLL